MDPSTYEKRRIVVRRRRSLATPAAYDEVDAFLVGGTDGVFAVWRVGEIIHFASGDDGHWWEIASYHEHWMHGILTAIGLAL